MYSVQWDGVRIKLSKSAGSAVKFFGRDALPNGMALGLMMFLTYASLTSAGILKNPSAETAPEMLQLSETLDDAPAFRMADEPTDSVYR
ncbi:MAG: hypothetical protein GY903_23270 [Fuerstiella sp.]|nr:hypothetical protein [Fuerstiella sp.]